MQLLWYEEDHTWDFAIQLVCLTSVQKFKHSMSAIRYAYIRGKGENTASMLSHLRVNDVDIG